MADSSKFRPFACDTCDKAFVSHSQLTSHIDGVHRKKRPFKCDTCDKTFRSAQQLKEHKSVIHDKLKPHKCDRCHKQFGYASQFCSHKKVCHFSLAGKKARKAVKRAQKHKCDRCDKIVSSSSMLKDHQAVAHDKVKLHQCKKCLKRFGYKSQLCRHVQICNDDITSDARLLGEDPETGDGNKCDRCDKTFKSKQWLKDHIKFVHDKLRMYECDKCHKKFGYQSNLSHHRRTVCQVSTSSSTELETRAEKSFECDKCNKRFRSSQSLKDHQAVAHDKVKLHQCIKCLKRFGYKSQLCQHARICNHDITSDAPLLDEDLKTRNGNKCDRCDKTFKSKQSLKDHITFVHNKLRMYQCELCLKKFGYQSNLSLHRRTVCKVSTSSSTELETRTENNFKCDDCGKMFGSSQTLKDHQAVAHDEVIHYQCDKCQQRFQYSSQLSGHKPYCHVSVSIGEPLPELPPTKSDICDKTFTSKVNFRDHIAVMHDKVKRHQCNRCHKRFGYRSCLNVHKRSCSYDDMSSKTKNKCDRCEKTFLSCKMLEDHKAVVHDKVKQYQCDNCHKRFGYCQHFYRHLRSCDHENTSADASRKCDICDRTFSSKVILRDHIAVAHDKVKRHQCSRCLMRFGYSTGLDQHKRFCTGADTSLDVKNKCDRCGKSFRSSLMLEDHKAVVHDKVKRYQCDKCPRRFGYKSLMYLHIRNCKHEATSDDGNETKLSHPIEAINGRFECVLCDKSYTSKQMLKAHKSVVHEYIKHFKCEGCHQRFGFRSMYMCHKRVCQKFLKANRKFLLGDCKCDKCDKLFSSRQSLEDHQAVIHDKVKLHQCDKCLKRFGHRSQLSRHKPNCSGSVSSVNLEHPIANSDNVNTQDSFVSLDEAIIEYPEDIVEAVIEDPDNDDYQCDSCHRAFASSISLKLHILTVHKLKCHTCHKTFLGQDQLNQHVDKDHRDWRDVDEACRLMAEIAGLTSGDTQPQCCDKSDIKCGECDQQFDDTEFLQIHACISHKSSVMLERLPFLSVKVVQSWSISYALIHEEFLKHESTKVC